MYRITRFFVSILTVLLISSCTEKTINNYTLVPSFGSVIGYVLPIDAGTTIRLEGTDLTASVNESGFFQIPDIPSGSYTLIIESVHYTRRVIQNVAIQAGAIRDFGELNISTHPAPLYRSEPPAGDTLDILMRGSLRVYTDEPFASEDLNEHSHTPAAVSGQWYQSASSGNWPWEYEFTLNGDSLIIGTDYYVTLDASLTSQWGMALGSDVKLHFRTEPLSVSTIAYNSELLGGAAIHNPAIRVYFNYDVDENGVNDAIRVEPAIEGFWTDDNPFPLNERQFQFRLTGDPLKTQTEYAIFISDTTSLRDGHTLPAADTTYFLTERRGVSEIYPMDGWNFDSVSISFLSLTFNVPMDTASVRSSFEFLASQFGRVVGGVSWSIDHRVMIFNPERALTDPSRYIVTLNHAALDADGLPLGHDFKSQFTIRY